ncbi:hypothetical protein E2C01_049124 [Portunus trituberculatus]|uniref:Uncharacterized protein n=1 Tax=Portunus trituberculatus TaxID=210409 RepID=A0A5B7GD35_PORTR|nr:hypothetical protein [Portunus trituberculatus]
MVLAVVVEWTVSVVVLVSGDSGLAGLMATQATLVPLCSRVTFTSRRAVLTSLPPPTYPWFCE